MNIQKESVVNLEASASAAGNSTEALTVVSLPSVARPEAAGSTKRALLDVLIERLRVGDPLRLPFGLESIGGPSSDETTIMRLDDHGNDRRCAIEVESEINALRVGTELYELSSILPMGILLSAFLHDLAQPLNVIKMAAYNLRASEGTITPDRQLTRLQRIEDQAAKAETLLRGLRTLVGSAVWRRRSRPASEILLEIGPLVGCFLERFYIGSAIAADADFDVREIAAATLPPVIVALVAEAPGLLGRTVTSGTEQEGRVVLGHLLVDGRPTIRLELERTPAADDDVPIEGGRDPSAGPYPLPLCSVRMLWAAHKLKLIGGDLTYFATGAGYRFDIEFPADSPPKNA